MHHDFSASKTEKSEEKIIKLINCLTSHHNPFEKEDQKLCNIFTQELVDSENCAALLNIFENSCDLYKEFLNERFVEKLKSLSDTIPKIKLPNFKTLSEDQSDSNKNVSIKKELKEGHKIIEIAKENLI